MSIDRGALLRVLQSADHPLGVRELLKQVGLHPGEQTGLKRALRELVREGAIEKLGKRFIVPGGPVKAERASEGPGPHRARDAGPGAEPGGGARRGDRRPQRAGAGRSERGARRTFPEAGRGRFGERGARGEQRGRLAAPSRSRQRRPAEDRAQFHEQLRALPDVVEGVLHVHRNGYGFVHPLQGGENVFLPPDEAAKALDGDRVLVQLVKGRGGRTAGVLLEVVDRVRQRAVGYYRQEGRRAWVEPHDTSLRSNIRVPPTQLARPGDLVKVVLGIGAAVLEPGVELYGEVVGSLGRHGEPSAEVLSIAYSQGFSDEFPEEVMAEADRYKIEVSPEEAAGEGRRDLRTLPLLTIDGEDARDFDDAVYCEPSGRGWRLVVAIADVSHYVREGRPLDAEALHRGTSVYLPDRVLPMLPERLSNGICSLRPGEDRLCMVADMQFDANAHLQSYELYPGVMRSVARCTYDEVQDVLDGKDVPHRNVFRPHFENLMALARALNRMRKARGAIDFDLPEYKVILDEKGRPVRLEKRERQDSHRLVEECMLAANEAVAKFFQERDLPVVYRYHGEPDEEKLEAFAQLARAHGFELPPSGQIDSSDLNQLLEQLEGHPEQRALNHLLLRAMMQAVYSAENVGHYGLGAAQYLHFTSPIRRYPDLLVHRLLKEHWRRGGKIPPRAEREEQERRLEELAVQASERERAAVAVEREVIAYYQTLMMKDRVGEEFDATVSSVTDFGFFVEVDEVYVEGLVKGEVYGPDCELDLATHSLVWPNGRRVKVGDKLRVILLSANVERRQLEFAPVEAARREGERAEPPARMRWERGEAGGEMPGAGREGASPHPGFDRLRALAQRAGERGGEEPRGRRAGGGRGGEDRGRAERDRFGASERGRSGGERESRGARGGEGRERFGGARTGGGRVERDKFGNAKRPAGGGGRAGRSGGPRKGGAGGGRSGGKSGGRRGGRGRR